LESTIRVSLFSYEAAHVTVLLFERALVVLFFRAFDDALEHRLQRWQWLRTNILYRK
jgi:hypothetical protein